jgi:hypothetical protein
MMVISRLFGFHEATFRTLATEDVGRSQELSLGADDEIRTRDPHLGNSMADV